MTAIAEETRFRASPSVVSRSIEGQAVVVSLDRRVMHELNEVGSRVWELLESCTVGEMADVVAREFDVARERALSDVCTFLAELRSLDAVEEVA